MEDLPVSFKENECKLFMGGQVEEYDISPTSSNSANHCYNPLLEGAATTVFGHNQPFFGSLNMHNSLTLDHAIQMQHSNGADVARDRHNSDVLAQQNYSNQRKVHFIVPQQTQNAYQGYFNILDLLHTFEPMDIQVDPLAPNIDNVDPLAPNIKIKHLPPDIPFNHGPTHPPHNENHSNHTTKLHYSMESDQESYKGSSSSSSPYQQDEEEEAMEPLLENPTPKRAKRTKKRQSIVANQNLSTSEDDDDEDRATRPLRKSVRIANRNMSTMLRRSDSTTFFTTDCFHSYNDSNAIEISRPPFAVGTVCPDFITASSSSSEEDGYENPSPPKSPMAAHHNLITHHNKDDTSYTQQYQNESISTGSSSEDDDASGGKVYTRHNSTKAEPAYGWFSQKNASTCNMQLPDGRQNRKSKTSKNHKCPECGRIYAYSNNMQRHLKSHAVDKKKKKHFCKPCEKSLSSKQYLNMHVAAVHKRQQRYVCIFCGEGFFFSDKLNRHHKDKKCSMRPTSPPTLQLEKPQDEEREHQDG